MRLDSMCGYTKNAMRAVITTIGMSDVRLPICVVDLCMVLIGNKLSNTLRERPCIKSELDQF